MGAGGGVLPAGGVLAAGGGGGVFVGGGGGVFPAVGVGGVFPADEGAFAAGGGGVFPVGGGVVFAADGGGAFPAGGGGVFPVAGGDFDVGEVAGLVELFASLGGALVPVALGSAVLASVCAGAGVYLTFLGFPKSRTVVSGKICVTIPAAIVFPPSLRANLEPLSIVIGKFNFALIVKLSPGLAILRPSGRQISAAVSAVLK